MFMWATACQSTIAHETICSVIVAPKMVTCFFCCSVSLLTLCFLLTMLPIASRFFCWHHLFILIPANLRISRIISASFKVSTKTPFHPRNLLFSSLFLKRNRAEFFGFQNFPIFFGWSSSLWVENPTPESPCEFFKVWLGWFLASAFWSLIQHTEIWVIELLRVPARQVGHGHRSWTWL